MTEEQQGADSDDSEPTPERQAELRASYDANRAEGKEPYHDVAIRTQGELRWVMLERGWSGEPELPEGYERANLSGADFYAADLSGAYLQNANLSEANLDSTDLSGADLSGFRLSDDVTLATLRIERMHLSAFMAERRGVERSDMLATDEVRHLLHCSATTLQRWHASKLLVPSQEESVGTKRHWWYRCQDVRTFGENYITVQEASVLLGCTRLTLQSWARAGMVPAVSGRHLDGAHSYRFDKAILVQWREHRMTSREAAEWLGISKPTLHRWVNQGKLIPLDKDKGKHRWFAKEEIVGYNKASSRNRFAPAGC